MLARKSLVLLAAGLLLASRILLAETITLGTGEYPPYTEEAAKGKGVVNEIVTEAFKRQGVTVQFKFLPWKRLLEDTRNGTFAASSYWFKNEEREKEFIFSKPFISNKEVFFYRKNNPLGNWSQLTDLAGKRIGMTRGYTYTSELNALVNSQQLISDVAVSDEQGLHKLLAGRMDLMIVDELVGWSLLSNPKQFTPGSVQLLATADKPLRETPGFLMFSKSHKDAPALLEKFNAGLEEMEKDGSLAKLQDSIYTSTR